MINNSEITSEIIKKILNTQKQLTDIFEKDTHHITWHKEVIIHTINVYLDSLKKEIKKEEKYGRLQN